MLVATFLTTSRIPSDLTTTNKNLLSNELEPFSTNKDTGPVLSTKPDLLSKCQ